MPPPFRMDQLTAALRLLGLGWYVAAALLLGIGGGVWLDKALGTTPWLMLVGLALGLTAAFWGMYKMLLPLLGGRRPRDP